MIVGLCLLLGLFMGYSLMSNMDMGAGDYRARMEIVALTQVVGHLAFLVDILSRYVGLPEDASSELQKQLKMIIDAAQPEGVKGSESK